MKAGTAILEAFYQASGQFVRADDIKGRLKLSAAAMAAEVADLEELGYTIESHPHFGYRLLGTPDRLTADDIRARLKTNVIGGEILVFEETASTNDVVEHLAKSGAREGLAVFAESQTRGRGRHGRAWVSPRGKGLWFSVLLRPKLPPSAASRITVAASVAVARAIRQSCGVNARIKWPNDVTVAGKKLAGILVETRSGIGPQESVFGGTGVPACESSAPSIRSFTVTRRNLPHWQDPGRVYFVTFRVHRGGSLNEEMQDIVLQACRHWHGQRYHLYAMTVMPDHVHLLLWPRPLETTRMSVPQASPPVDGRTVAEDGFYSLSGILHSLKSFTAHEIQRRYGWRGSVWMDESFDRIVRDDAEFSEKWNYIAQNSVKKGLATTTEDYRWFWYAPEPLGVEPEKQTQAGTPVPPKENNLQQCIILGIGIDVNCAREELPEIATSLQIETGRPHDRTALAAAVLSELDNCYRLAQTEFERVSDEWAGLCTTLGRQIVVAMGERRIEGHAQALDGDGALLLRRDNGQIERLVAGDVTVERT